MPLTLPDDGRQRAVAALQRWSADALAEPLGELGAGLLLDVVLDEIGPSIYSRQAGVANRALADAQRHLAGTLADLDVEIGMEEFPGEARR